MKKINIRIMSAALAFVATIIVVGLLVLNIVVIKQNDNFSGDIMKVLLIIGIIVSLFLYAIIMVTAYKTRLSRINEIINSNNAIEYSQDEIFEVGRIIFDEELRIIFITPWLQREGLYKFLGKNISKLGIDLDSNKTQKWVNENRTWNALVSRKTKTILLKDETQILALKEIINSGQKAIVAIHTSFSKKLNFNDSNKAEADLKIKQFLQEWANKIGGILNTSSRSEKTTTIVFDWVDGKKDLLSEDVLKKLTASISKWSKDITISVGASFGLETFNEVFEKAMKSLEISKNRGGDQIIIENPNGQIDYIGSSQSQAVSSNILNIKRFYSQFIEDVEDAREIFIVSHNYADLDALGASLGLAELCKRFKSNTYIIMNSFDSVAEKFFETLPKTIKDKFISEKDAKELVTNKSHFIITDTADPDSTQASNLLKDFLADKISVIDHHRMSKKVLTLIENKTLIDTSISSASEIIVEMLKISFGNEAQAEINKFVSTALLSGIQLDSKQLTKNVSSTTFEAVSFLLSNDANIIEINELFKPSQKLIASEAEALANIIKPTKDTIFSFIPETMVVSDEETSIIANKLLEYEGIEATFILAKVSSGKFKLSARSNNIINVQDIVESLGGGGHFNSAAVMWTTNIKYSTVKKRIINAINKGSKGSK